MKQAVVDIILPTRNTIGFLNKRIDSILAQDFKDWRIIHVDSDSEDGSIEFVRDRIPASRLLQIQAPIGLYQSWNRGLLAAEAPFVHIATGDDFESPVFYSTLLGSLQQTRADFINCGLHIVDEKMNPLVQSPGNFWPSEVFGWQEGRTYEKPLIEDFCFSLFLYHSAFSMNSALFRREFLVPNRLFPIEFGAAGDWAWYLFSRAHGVFLAHDRCLATWTLRKGQSSEHYWQNLYWRRDTEIRLRGVNRLLNSQVIQALSGPALETLKSWRREFLALQKCQGIFLLKYLVKNPDAIIHAGTKAISPLWLPFYFRKRRLRRFLAHLQVANQARET